MTFDELSEMPAYKYWLIKRSVDLEVMRQRKLFMSDVATAFSDPKKGISQLERQEKQMEQLYNSMLKRTPQDEIVASVDWDFPDENASKKLRRWQR